MKKIQWGIIGCGNVTEVKSGPAFNKVKDSALVAVMRRNGEKAADYARRHGVPKWYDDAQQVIDDPEVNAIYVATPPESHEAYTLRAFKAGKPVYVEKPMSTDSASARRMLQASIDTGMKLCVAHYRKAQPRFKKVKALLEDKAIGDIRMIALQLVQPPASSLIAVTDENWRVNPAISGGGLFHDLSPHQLDLLQYLFGKHVQAKGFARNQAGLYPADDLVMGNIIFSNGAVCNGSWCFTGAENEAQDNISIIGSEGTISFATFSTNHITVSKKGEEQVIRFDELPHVQQPMIEEVVKYFLGQGANPSAAESAVATMEVIDAFTKDKGAGR
ncbi:MAG: Gfo/Idh/MocA family oxidoreductase [Chitinophagaceae bacterium]